jgi:uncharacterized protein (DUF952 family)
MVGHTNRVVWENNVALFYKIISAAEWHKAEVDGVFKGSALDLKDGYIHLSTEAQVKETARLHFAGQKELVLVCVDEASVRDELKWEASRGAQLFPHIYADLDPAKTVWVKELVWNGSHHVFPVEVAL